MGITGAVLLPAALYGAYEYRRRRRMATPPLASAAEVPEIALSTAVADKV